MSPESYGMNAQVAAVSFDRVVAPDQTFLFFDADARVRSFSGGLRDVALYRHDLTASSNVVHVDGHARWLRSLQLAENRWDPAKPPVYNPKSPAF